jgi:MinD-like ATPase involved in chromosome partitioning or flagellar assembly
MKITVYNFKGGTGKTSLAMAIAKELDTAYITNDAWDLDSDNSMIAHIFKKEERMELGFEDEIPNLPDDINVVFDLGGFPSPQAISAIKQSDVVVIPTENESKTLQKTINTISAVTEYNSNILVVANKIKTTKDYENICSVLDSVFKKNFKIPSIRFSKGFDHIYEKGKSLSNIMKEDKLLNYNFNGVKRDLDVVISQIKKFKKQTKRVA